MYGDGRHRLTKAHPVSVLPLNQEIVQMQTGSSVYEASGPVLTR